MAEEALVAEQSDPFFQSVAKAVASLERARGPLYAALLAKLPDGLADDWVFLAGSTMLADDRFEGIRAMVQVLKEAIPAKYSSRIRRVDVLRLDDPVYAKLSQAFRLADGADLTLVNCKVLGLQIEYAKLFVLRRVPTSSANKASQAKRSRQRRTVGRVQRVGKVRR